MSKQPIPPPPGDKPVPSAPPPPPAWRHWLWPGALLVMVVLYLFLPGIHLTQPVSLHYSQFISDANAHKVKDVTFGSGTNGSNTTVTGTLTSGKDFTTVIPGQPTPQLSAQLTADGVKSVTAAPPTSSLGSELLYFAVVVFLPLAIVFYLFRRMSRGAAGGLPGVPGCRCLEMFVGGGAARVRDLFAEARKRAPCIIFVDEIDAIGQRRAGTGQVVANDEREQTLNQLLAEMDGFEMTQGIVVLAATNRPEVLDPALLRPGRFDRQVTIPLPTLAERAAILAVHSRGKRLGPDVDLMVVARGTPGFSGADLANLVNEAAIFAVRDNREIITAADFAAARDRILLGRREDSNVLLPEEKHAVAVHESGHALVAVLSEHADPVAKVTILPAGQALGVTEQLPLVERHLYGEDYLKQSLAVRLGGRAAELVELGQGSTGAANDLASATDLATRMVREFGLSDALGPVGYPEGGSVFLGGGGSGLSSRPFAEATQAIIDTEVSRLLREAEETAVSLIRTHRKELTALTNLLLEKETVDGEEVYALVGVPMPENRQDAHAIAPVRATAPADGLAHRADAEAAIPRTEG